MPAAPAAWCYRCPGCGERFSAQEGLRRHFAAGGAGSCYRLARGLHFAVAPRIANACSRCGGDLSAPGTEMHYGGRHGWLCSECAPPMSRAEAAEECFGREVPA